MATNFWSSHLLAPRLTQGDPRSHYHLVSNNRPIWGRISSKLRYTQNSLPRSFDRKTPHIKQTKRVGTPTGDCWNSVGVTCGPKSFLPIVRLGRNFRADGDRRRTRVNIAWSCALALLGERPHSCPYLATSFSHLLQVSGIVG